MTTFAIATLGCKVNTYESQNYLECLKEAGYTEVDFREKADIYVINTCSVTNTAAAKSRQKIHQARRQNPAALVAVVGCYAQAADPADIASLQADVVIGAQGKSQLAERIAAALDKKGAPQPMMPARSIHVFESLDIHAFSHQTRAFLKIQDGCNQFCSYCIIPYARGAERSIAPAQAVSIARTMAEHGHQEIVLSGIHTGRYGRDQGTTLLQLLKQLIDATPEQVRYRISSIEMNEIDDAFIAYMKQEPRIARHLHIPIQAASDEVLAAMNRPYDTAWFAQRMRDIRAQLPGISISTDMIAGFPQESDEQFAQALELVEKELRFSFIHCFPYSRRDHTRAAQMPGHLPNQVKKARAAQLGELSERLHHAYMETFLGKQADVIIERQKEGMLFGYSSEYIPVYIPWTGDEMPKRAYVRLDGFCREGIHASEMEVIS